MVNHRQTTDNEYNQRTKHLFISPHLDDATLSCGAQIAHFTSLEHTVLIVSIFAGQPKPSELSDLAKRFHESCGLGDDAIKVRREEDSVAARVLGAAFYHLDLLECLYRVDRNGYPLYSKEGQIFTTDTSFEKAVVDSIVSDLRALISPAEYACLHLPLGIGHHIDHLLVREAVEKWLETVTRKDRIGIEYYEDLPYACGKRDPSWQRSLAKKMTPWLYYFDESLWRTKVAAISAYPSQIQMLWNEPSRMEIELRNYAERAGNNCLAERVWLPYL